MIKYLKYLHDLNINYVLDYIAYPSIVQSCIKIINDLVHTISYRQKNIEQDFTLLYNNICLMYQLFSSV